MDFSRKRSETVLKSKEQKEIENHCEREKEANCDWDPFEEDLMHHRQVDRERGNHKRQVYVAPVVVDPSQVTAEEVVLDDELVDTGLHFRRTASMVQLIHNAIDSSDCLEFVVRYDEHKDTDDRNVDEKCKYVDQSCHLEEQ